MFINHFGLQKAGKIRGFFYICISPQKLVLCSEEMWHVSEMLEAINKAVLSANYYLTHFCNN